MKAKSERLARTVAVVQIRGSIVRNRDGDNIEKELRELRRDGVRFLIIDMRELATINAAGMHTVGITNTYDAGQLSMAEKIITRLSDLEMSDLQALCI